MFGGLLSLLSAVTFAYANVTVRRGVLSGSVFQAVLISVLLGVPLFAAVLAAASGFSVLGHFSKVDLLFLSAAGAIHFGGARYCNYRATQAMGANLVAPVQQLSLLITLILAVLWLNEAITLLRMVGIVVLMAGPMLMVLSTKGTRRSAPKVKQPEDIPVATFAPKYAEGYAYGFLSALGYGISPVLIRASFQHDTIVSGIAAGFISYVAAAVVVGAFTASPRSIEEMSRLDSQALRWFALSAIAVGISQLLRYVALAIAPVSIVTPIQRSSLIFRYYFSHVLNPDHEVFGGSVLLSMIISLSGAIMLALSGG